MVWAINYSTGQWKEHLKYGVFEVTLDETLGNVPMPISDDIKGKVERTSTGIE